MKTHAQFLAVLTLILAALAPSAFALPVPSDGSDGALNITGNTVIDLSQASYGLWSSDNSTNAGNGIYDSNQWAVVFKYSSVNIANNGSNTGFNVTFLNHPTHAPVVWLVQGNVTINGIVNLNGQPGTTAVPNEYTPTEPGPGGFRGGAYSPLGGGAGYGPGGGSAGSGNGYSGYDAGYTGIYGNPQILPLIGGSGEGEYDGASGGGAGGAILIVAGGTVTVNGQITALGSTSGGGTGTASSGAIRIVANQILGNGMINASGGNTADGTTAGRTRMEANVISSQLNIFPNAAVVPPGATPTIWPATNAPTVSVMSVDSQPAPIDPSAAVSTSSDVGIQSTNAVNIILQTQNLPIQGTVSLRITPKYGAATVLSATYLSGNVNQAAWQVTTILPQGFCVLQARATAP